MTRTQAGWCARRATRPVRGRWGRPGATTLNYRLWDAAEIWKDRWVAGDSPGVDATDLSSALYQSRYLSNSGRLFFNSSDALVPADVNGTEDVYEYEPAGTGRQLAAEPGATRVSSDVFSPKRRRLVGCVGLISAGTSSGESTFMDASETGGDVFFLTPSGSYRRITTRASISTMRMNAPRWRRARRRRRSQPPRVYDGSLLQSVSHAPADSVRSALQRNVLGARQHRALCL